MPLLAWQVVLTLFRFLFPRPAPSVGVLALTAALLSRLVLPPPHRVVRWPHPTGQIRAAGKWYYAIYAASCLIWAALGYWGCQQIADWAASWQPAPTAPPARTPGALATEAAGTWDNLNRTLLPNAGAWFVGAVVAVVLTAAGVKRFGQRPGRRLRFWADNLYFFTYVALRGVLYGAAAVAVFCGLAVAFPELTTGGELTARLPWQVWYGVLVVLLAYKQSSPINPRVVEFTSLPSDSPDTWLFRLIRLVWEDDHRSCKTTKREDALAGHELNLARESEKLASLRAWRAFYEREGLCALFRSDSPERRYYTSEQRLAFRRAYSVLVTAIRKSEWWVDVHRRWIAEARENLAAESAGGLSPSAATT